MKLVFPGGEHPQVLLGPGRQPDRLRSAGEHRPRSPRRAAAALPAACHRQRRDAGRAAGHHGQRQRPPGRWPDRAASRRQRRVRPGAGTPGIDGIRRRGASRRGHSGPPAGIGQRRSGRDRRAPGGAALRVARRVGRGVRPHLSVLGVTTVGRAAECDMRLDEPGMSRMHARLLPTDDGVLLEDLGSTNGSFLNGKRVLRGEAQAPATRSVSTPCASA